MLQVLALVLPLFSLILLGYLCARLLAIPIEGLAWLNIFVIYIALPALFFQLLSRTPVEQFSEFAFFASTTLATFLIFSLGVGIALLRRRGALRAATIQGLAGAYGNIGYLGPPLAITAFGPAAGVPVALVFCFDNAMHFSLAPLLMALGEDKKDGTRTAIGTLLLQIAIRILLHPFIIATLAGVAAAFLAWQPPGPFDQLLTRLADAAAPCALFAMGVTAARRPLKRVPVELGWLIPVKLVLHPLLVYLLVSRLPGVEPVWLYSAVLLAALPTATNVFVLAQQYGVWEERASSAVVLSTLLSVVSVPAYLYLIADQISG